MFIVKYKNITDQWHLKNCALPSSRQTCVQHKAILQRTTRLHPAPALASCVPMVCAFRRPGSAMETMTVVTTVMRRIVRDAPVIRHSSPALVAVSQGRGCVTAILTVQMARTKRPALPEVSACTIQPPSFSIESKHLWWHRSSFNYKFPVNRKAPYTITIHYCSTP